MIRLCCTFLLSIGATGTSPVLAKLDGVEAASSSKAFKQGRVVDTGNDLDLAIIGAGFFQVKPGQGDPLYTRDGSFKRDSSGTLMTSQGYLLQPSVVIPSDATVVVFGQDGHVSIMKGDTGAPTEIGTISLFIFPKDSALEKRGENLCAESSSSGSPVQTSPGVRGAGLVRQSAHELSYFEAVAELVGGILAPENREIHYRVVRDCSMLERASNVVLTGYDLDLSIVGAGFFQVKTQQGELQYTRDGSFLRDAAGMPVTAHGASLQPAIVIPPDATSVLISRDGRVAIMKGDTGTVTEIGTISLFRFANEGGLKALGGNSYSETVSSGKPQQAAPGSAEAGILQQCALERSRVQIVGDLVALIFARRHGILQQLINTVHQ